MSDYWPDWKVATKREFWFLICSHTRQGSDPASHYGPGPSMSKAVPTGNLYFTPTPGYDLRVSEGLYLIDSYPDTVYKAITGFPLLKSRKYAYSDLGFVILPKVIEKLSGESYESFLHDKLYARLGASTLMYHPRLSEPKEKIVPTEDDQVFRHELLQGFVHDETAALMGGVRVTPVCSALLGMLPK